MGASPITAADLQAAMATPARPGFRNTALQFPTPKPPSPGVGVQFPTPGVAAAARATAPAAAVGTAVGAVDAATDMTAAGDAGSDAVTKGIGVDAPGMSLGGFSRQEAGLSAPGPSLGGVPMGCQDVGVSTQGDSLAEGPGVTNGTQGLADAAAGGVAGFSRTPGAGPAAAQRLKPQVTPGGINASMWPMVSHSNAAATEVTAGLGIGPGVVAVAPAGQLIAATDGAAGAAAGALEGSFAFAVPGAPGQATTIGGGGAAGGGKKSSSSPIKGLVSRGVAPSGVNKVRNAWLDLFPTFLIPWCSVVSRFGCGICCNQSINQSINQSKRKTSYANGQTNLGHKHKAPDHNHEATQPMVDLPHTS